MRHGGHALRARFRPPDRPAEPASQRPHHHVLRVDVDLRAEATADGRRHDPQLRLIDPHRFRQPRPRVVGSLAGDPHGQPVLVAAGHGQDRVRLQGHGGQALIDESAFHDHLSSRQRVRVAEGALHGHVAPVIGEQHGRARLGGSDRIHQGGKRVVVDEHRLGRVGRLHPRLRHDHRDRLSHEPDRAGGQHRLGERIRHHPRAERAEAQIGRREDPDHPRHRGRVLPVDAQKAGVGHRRAHEGRVQGSVRGEVVDEARGARDQPGVFDPEDGMAEDRSCGQGRHSLAATASLTRASGRVHNEASALPFPPTASG